MSSGARLVWQRADGARVEFPLGDEPLLVGRGEEADIRVDEPLVSRLHARVEPRPEGYALVDLGSTNYTRVNGERVTEQLLRHGDEVRFARARCEYLEISPRPADDAP
jgi:pSer/pThr/pTyr-binding forkhead associated (FHA) protein